MNDVIASAWSAEEALLTAGVRSDAHRLRALLAPEFYEIGQSGHRWSRDEVVVALANETSTHQNSTTGATEASATPVAELTEREERHIAPDTVLLSYRLDFESKVSRRSSLWRRRDGSVECLFHQGTPLPRD